MNLAKNMRNRRDRDDRAEPFSIEAWTPKTRMGEMVKNKEITSIEDIFKMGKPIKEVEIIDALLPNIKDSVLEIAIVQRMTKNNRKAKYRVTVVVGDGNGHVGVGTGKDVEVRPAITSAIKDAKMNIIPVSCSCGSWECNCKTNHSLPMKAVGRCGSAYVILKPAPRGIGVVANKIIKQVVALAGIKDVWSFTRGRTRNIYNTAMATYKALESINKISNHDALKTENEAAA